MLINYTLQEKILMMSAWKGMSMKYFPARELLNQANAIELQKATGQMFNHTEMGTIPMMPQLPAVPANNGPIKVTLENGNVVEGTLYTDKPEDHVTSLRSEIADLRKEVHSRNAAIDKLVEFVNPLTQRVAKLEKSS